MKLKPIIILVCLIIGHPNNLSICSVSNENETSSHTSKFEDTFTFKNSIIVPKEKIKNITDFLVDFEGKFLIADGWGLGKIAIFNEKGKFIKESTNKINKTIEIDKPVSITQNQKKQYLILDYLKRNIFILDKSFKLIKKLTCPQIGHYVRTDHNNNLYLFHGISRDNTINKYDENGTFIKSFCEFPSNISNKNFYSLANGLLITSDFVFEMNPLNYRVRKYNLSGEFIQSFNKMKHLREKVKKENSEKNNRNKVILSNGPYLIDTNLVITQLRNYLEIYNFKGVLKTRIIDSPGKVIYTTGRKLFVQMDNGKTDNDNFKIKIFEYVK